MIDVPQYITAITQCRKYVYVYDNKIVCNENNNKYGDGYDNRHAVLRYVIGV